MQVKKFEARSMKEALDMIKREFGHEAIILSAKDNSQRYGLLGEGSVEVTAAISESSLQKKKFIETKLPDHIKEIFVKAPARRQKEWVEKLISSYRQDNQNLKKKTEVKKAIEERRYIDITDDIESDQTQAELLDLASRTQDHIEKKEKESHDTKQVTQLQKEIEELKHVVQNLKSSQASSEVASNSSASALNLPIELISIYEKLKVGGLRAEFALNLLDLAKKNIPSPKHSNKGLVEGWIVNYVLDNSKVVMPTKKVQLFLGPSGSGKTTLLVKWATHLIMRMKKKVALVTCDQVKLGAVQQMRMYAQILNVPFVSLTKKSDWSYVIQELKECDHILCDFHGTSLKNEEESKLLQDIVPIGLPDCDRHLVLNAATSRGELNQIYANYRALQPTTLSFTRLDETRQRGYIFEMSYLHRIPIFALSVGQKIPDDFELATQERIVDFVLQISNSGGIHAFR
jgi:flagellar biosynthesis protein FlhF